MSMKVNCPPIFANKLDPSMLPALSIARTKRQKEVYKESFIPYTALPSLTLPKHPPLSQQIAPKELEGVRMLAMEFDARRELDEEKRRLHEKSMARVQNWNHTVLGQRKRRLAAQDERIAKLEEDRLKVDAEWAKIRIAERQAAIDRARQMIWNQDPRVRDLMGAAGLSNVLQERDRQVTYRAQKALLRHQIEQSECQQVLQTAFEAEISAREADEKKRMERRAVAEIVKEQVRIQKDADRAVKLKSDQWQVDRNAEAESELRVREEKECQKKMKQIEEMRNFVLQDRAMKQVDKQKAENEAAEIAAANNQFNTLKKITNDKRKLFEASRIKAHEDQSKRVEHLALEEEKNRSQKVDEYIETGVQQHAGDYDRRLRKEREKRERMVREGKEFLEKHNKIIKSRERQEKEADLARRAQFENDAMEFFKGLENEKLEKAKKLDSLRAIQADQIAKNLQTHHTEHLNSKLPDQAVLDAARDLADYRAFADDLIDEWKQNGKDVKPLLRVVSRDVEVKPCWNGLDTFQRVGFRQW